MSVRLCEHSTMQKCILLKGDSRMHVICMLMVYNEAGMAGAEVEKALRGERFRTDTVPESTNSRIFSDLERLDDFETPLSEICKEGSVKPIGFRILQRCVGKWCEEVLRWRGNHHLGLWASLHPDQLYFYVFCSRLLDKE